VYQEYAAESPPGTRSREGPGAHIRERRPAGMERIHRTTIRGNVPYIEEWDEAPGGSQP